MYVVSRMSVYIIYISILPYMYTIYTIYIYTILFIGHTSKFYSRRQQLLNIGNLLEHL